MKAGISIDANGAFTQSNAWKYQGMPTIKPDPPPDIKTP